MILLHVPTFSLAAAAQQDSPWHRLQPRARLLVALLVVLGIACLPRGLWNALAVYAGVLLVGLAVSRVPIQLLLGRLGVELAFVSVLFLTILFSGRGAPIVQWGPLTVASDSLRDCLDALAKAFLSLWALNLLTLTTAAPNLMQALAELRCPPLILRILESMLRYLAVLVDELGSMRRAAQARAGASTLLGWNTLGNILGALFLRTYGRGERVYLAMQARGFTGTFPGTAGRTLNLSESVLVGLVALSTLISLSLHWWNPS